MLKSKFEYTVAVICFGVILGCIIYLAAVLS